ncbi:putative aminoacrylate hydrolase RutD [Rubinisphaera italica]|uniref:Putative aminoacrylate hydrolase RutD n=1 Tax=Rubinisphaera italica TaxID=2527969 RepID=A0A5C5XH30_9PLAN|nr:putative aminoacrylate hydrolase RutD [Rubinisphaera italica]
MLTLIQRKLIYHPTKVATLNVKDWEFAEGRCLPVTFEVEPGYTLHGWHVLPPSHQALNRKEQQQELDAGRPVIIYYPGNAGHRGYRADQLKRLSSLNADIFLIDYRGYAENPGSPSEKAYLHDARFILDALVAEYQIEPARFVLLGESLGGGIATALANQLSQEGTELAGLFLQAPFSSLVAIAGERFPWLPVDWMMVDRYPSIERIPEVTCPITIIHGRQDSIIPFAQAQQLFETAPDHSSAGISKTFLEIPGAGHNDIFMMAETEYLRALEKMLKPIRQSNIPNP